MQTKQNKLGLMALAIAMALVTSAPAAEKEGNGGGISLTQVPEAVQKTIKEHAAEAEITKIEKTDEKDKVVYEVDITKNSKKSEIVVAADGALLRTEETVAWADLPAASRKTIETQAGHSKVSRVEKLVENGKTSYEAVFMQGKKKAEVTVAPDGKLLATEDITREKD